MLGRWLRLLGEEPARIPDGLGERAELMRAWLTGRRVLIVLDNVPDIGRIPPLLPAGAPCAAIVTSRADLAALYGMTRIRMPVMPARDALALVTGLIGEARIAAEPEHVRRLLQACGHLPLALRIAGARLAARPHWTVARLADRLDQAHRLTEALAVRQSMQAPLWQAHSLRALAAFHQDMGDVAPTSMISAFEERLGWVLVRTGLRLVDRHTRRPHWSPSVPPR